MERRPDQPPPRPDWLASIAQWAAILLNLWWAGCLFVIGIFILLCAFGYFRQAAGIP